MKNVNIMGLQKNLIGGRGRKKPIHRRELPKKWDWRFKEGLAKKREGVFLRGRRLITQCTL